MYIDRAPCDLDMRYSIGPQCELYEPPKVYGSSNMYFGNHWANLGCNWLSFQAVKEIWNGARLTLHEHHYLINILCRAYYWGYAQLKTLE